LAEYMAKKIQLWPMGKGRGLVFISMVKVEDPGSGIELRRAKGGEAQATCY